MYSHLIIPDIVALEGSKSKSKGKRNNVLNVVKNLESVFPGVYLHYNKGVSKKTLFEKGFTERTKLRRERLDEIERKNQNINYELFKANFSDYQSQSNIYIKLSEAKETRNK